MVHKLVRPIKNGVNVSLDEEGTKKIVVSSPISKIRFNADHMGLGASFVIKHKGVAQIFECTNTEGPSL